ncbi:glycosyltransferase family 4 protein [bacterium]|nr:glycosyltransferase family 4 protein [bacterium]
MHIVYITAGSGRMECDACVRDGELARAYMRLGHDVLFIPTYTPLVTEDAREMAVSRIFYGGISVYLRHRFPLFRRMPGFLDRLFDARPLLRLASRLGDMTDAKSLADLTVSVLEGEGGEQQRELHRMLDWLEEQGPADLIVLPNSLFAGLAGPLRRRLGAPVLCLLSGEDAFIEAFPEPYRSQTLEVLRRKARDLDAFLAPSRYYRDFMSRYLDQPLEKVHLAPLGIDCGFYPTQPGEFPPIFTIGYRSPIAPNNGLHLLVDAFLDLKKRPGFEDCRLHVAGFIGGGDRPYYEKQVQRIRSAGFEKDFAYAGELDPASRIEFLKGLSVLSVPTVYPEPSGMFVAEALAAGVPVVEPRSGCLTEWVEETAGGLLVAPQDSSALAEGIARLKEDPALADRLRRQGKKAICEEHHVDRMARVSLALFEKIREERG